MQKRRPLTAAVTGLLGLALVSAGLPADASEVVKLARLVITGKRLSAERLEPVAQQRAPLPLARSVQPAPPETASIAAGQDVLPRSAAAPARCVISFF